MPDDVVPPVKTSAERLIVLGLGAIIVLAMLYVVVFGVTMQPENFGILRFLLAIAAACVGVFLPGAVFEVGGTFGSVPIKAAGGAAFFAVVWFGLSAPAAAGPLTVASSQIDLRPEFDPRDGLKQALDSRLAMVLPVMFTQDAKHPKVIVTEFSVLIEGGGIAIRFAPSFLTQLQEHSGGGWLPSYFPYEEKQTFAAGQSVEVALFPTSRTSWREFLKTLQAKVPDNLTVTVTMSTDHGQLNQQCYVFDLQQRYPQPFTNAADPKYRRISKECKKR